MNDFDAHRAAWTRNEELAERMIPHIGALHRDGGVVTSIHGHRLVGLSATGVIAAHERAEQVGHERLSLQETLDVIEMLRAISPAPASIDVARLATERPEGAALEEYLREALAPVLGETSPQIERDVVLYGFGRIGRLLARILIQHAGGGSGLRLRGIVVRRGSDTENTCRCQLQHSRRHDPGNRRRTCASQRAGRP